MNDFDFLAGRWDVRNRRRRRILADCEEWDEFPGRAECTRLFGGAANVDTISFPSLGQSGLTVRLFDRELEEWSIYWASSRDGILQQPVTGRFAGGEGWFYGDDTFQGRLIRVRYIWSGMTDHSARWEQAFSADGEETWETNWIMNLTRA